MSDVDRSRPELQRKLPRRHPAEVTADRLGDAVTRWSECFTAQERDDIGFIIHRLGEIAEGRTDV